MNYPYEIRILCDILLCTLTHKKIRDDISFDAGILERIIRSQGITLSVYPALKSFNSGSLHELRERLTGQYYADLAQTIRQQSEGAELLDALEENHIDHIALKGWVMKKLYPEPTYRNMSDIDILVRDYDYNIISDIMAQKGYTSECESSWMHDTFLKGKINIEMHKRLTDDSGVICRWERSMWEHARLAEGKKHEYLMSDEDYLIFHMIHMHKDYVNGSLGLRRLLDLWYYLQVKKGRLDSKYLNETFREMKLFTFVKKMTDLSRSLFGSRPLDDDGRILIGYIAENGIYGTERTYKLGRMVSRSASSKLLGKIRSFTDAIFLPWDRMKAHFPILRKYPVLLPVMWMRRILGHLRHADKYVSKLNYSNISDSDYQKMKKIFKAGGIL
ncbi:MAG: nucleotidyltransferase family protein [Oscillospiraceae bacterium]|nr:nucleotidyltransferase family protein [Oscillospiraceae bacterium]